MREKRFLQTARYGYKSFFSANSQFAKRKVTNAKERAVSSSPRACNNMPRQRAREWICRYKAELAAVTEQMVAEAIANGISLTNAAAAWKVDKACLHRRIQNEKWGINGTWPRLDATRAKRAREAMPNIDFTQRTYASVAKEFGVSISTISDLAQQLSGGAPVVNRVYSQAFHDHHAQLERQLKDGSVRRVCVGRVATWPVWSIPSPSVAPLCCLTAG